MFSFLQYEWLQLTKIFTVDTAIVQLPPASSVLTTLNWGAPFYVSLFYIYSDPQQVFVSVPLHLVWGGRCWLAVMTCSSWGSHPTFYSDHCLMYLNKQLLPLPPDTWQTSQCNKDISSLTNNMDQSPSWQANSHSASQEIARLFWNPTVRYHVHKNPQGLSPVSHFLTSWLFRVSC